jgi:primosomal protein N' (replication factor Y)
VRQDYRGFFDRETQFRKMMAYPPFVALANIIVRDTILERAVGWARQLSEYFAPHNGKGLHILGPAAAPLARLKKEHRFQFLLKCPRRSLMTKVLGGAIAYCDGKNIPQTAVLVDVDPLSLM